MMQKRIEPKLVRYAFDSLAELARFIADTPRTWRANASKTNFATYSWDLGAGYEGALELAREGWLEGAQTATKALREFTPKTPSVALRTDFYGHMPHVPRFCAGAPDNMIRHHKTPTIGGGRVLTLYVPVNALGSVDAKYMRNFGLGVAQYINQLESDGLRVELYGMCVSDGDISEGCISLSHSWLLKRADQPLDLAVVAFSIGHPAMFRRLVFALRERSECRELLAYGSSRAAKLSDLIEPVSGAVILNGMRNADVHARTPEAALEYVGTEIDKAIEAQLEGVI